MPLHEDIKHEREKLGLSIEKCAEIIKSSPEYWAGCEDGTKKMHYGLWELFFIKVRSPKKYGLKIRGFKDIGKEPEYKFHYLEVGEDWIFHGNDEWQNRVIQAVKALQFRTVMRFKWLKIEGKESLVVKRVEDCPITERPTRKKYDFHDISIGESVTFSGSAEEKKRYRGAIRAHSSRYGAKYKVREKADGDLVVTKVDQF